VQVAIDDFSFNAVSLRHLQELDVNFLKLGPDVTSNLELPLFRNLVRGAVLAADSMGCKVIAEGIELPGQIETLVELGCHWGQGHFLKPPVPLEEIRELLAAPRR
jgi:EAL domain-containing protein (putative c-di-GMP-specific phosphodiesterase class I)